MTREEFTQKYEEITGKEPNITESDYQLIEFVYTFHPSIGAVEGKKQIAYIYSQFGMALIKDMLPRAKEMEKLESEWRTAQAKVEAIARKIQDVKYGYDM